MLIGVDTGGTFTDFIYKGNGTWQTYKLLSTPHNPSEAVLEGINRIAGGRESRIVHGSTVATNAVLELKGAKTALVTNKSFEDIIEIGRQNREELYSLHYQRKAHFVPSELRFGMKGRINAAGEEDEFFDEAEALEIAQKISGLGVKSAAVCFFFSFLNPKHENRMGSILEEFGISVSLSHKVLREFREFERMSTTLINAYVLPVMYSYIKNIAESVQEDNLVIMQSNGGRISARTAEVEPVRTVLSGPAGGVVGAFEIGRAAGLERLITFDMGGTSTDVALIDGDLPVTHDSHLSGFPLRVPMIDIHTVGAGGGSIARIDQGGALAVGPHSAGADPGPVCYGKGEELTVTDANLFLGRLQSEFFLDGRMKLDEIRPQSYLKDMADKMGLEPTELAEGVCSVVNAAMERAVRVISVERGYDPREFTMVSYGGAGGMHAAFLARLLNIPRVLIPKNCGILSALGMLMADVIRDYSLTIMLEGSITNMKELAQYFSFLEEQGWKDLAKEGLLPENMFFEHFLDMRYKGQSYELTVPFKEDYAACFHAFHEKRYGYSSEGKEIEIVNVRLKARGLTEKPKLKQKEKPHTLPLEKALVDTREVVLEGKSYKTEIFARNKLGWGSKLKGPAVVVDYYSTVVLPPEAVGEIDRYDNMLITV